MTIFVVLLLDDCAIVLVHGEQSVTTSIHIMINTVVTIGVDDAPISVQFTFLILSFDNAAGLEVYGANNTVLAAVSLANLSKVSQVVVLLAPLTISANLRVDLDGSMRWR